LGSVTTTPQIQHPNLSPDTPAWAKEETPAAEGVKKKGPDRTLKKKYNSEGIKSYKKNAVHVVENKEYSHI
jgi:hypothetical protein